MSEAVIKQSERQKIREGLQVHPDELDSRQLKVIGWEEKGFDLRVHITDPKTGQLLKYQPYRRVCDQNGVTYFRRDESGVERRYSEQGVCLDAPAVAMPALPVERKSHVDPKLSHK